MLNRSVIEQNNKRNSMSDHPLYRELEAQISSQIDPRVPASSRERLTLLVMGIIKAKSVAPSKIAQALDEVGVCEGTQESIERRIRRMEHDPYLTPVLCFRPFVRHLLRIGNPQHMVLALDPTTQDERVVMVTVSLVYHGRTLPLAWVIWPGNQPLKGKGFWERIQEMIDELWLLLPTAKKVIWLADRAFGTPVFTDMITAYGWDYVVRVQGQTRYRDVLERINTIDSLVQKPGQRCKRRAQAFKSHQWRWVSIVAFWGTRHQKPLLLVTSLPPQWDCILLYRRRYQIEATFRDFKSYGWHLEDCKITVLDHLQPLLVGMAFATWFTLMAGTQVASELLEQTPTARRHTRPFQAKFSLFSLGLQRLHQWLCRNCRHSLAWRLIHWHTLSWQRLLTAHHARAFVFAPPRLRRYHG